MGLVLTIEIVTLPSKNHSLSDTCCFAISSKSPQPRCDNNVWCDEPNRAPRHNTRIASEILQTWLQMNIFFLCRSANERRPKRLRSKYVRCLSDHNHARTRTADEWPRNKLNARAETRDSPSSHSHNSRKQHTHFEATNIQRSENLNKRIRSAAV